MFVAVGSPEAWPFPMTAAWGCLWALAAVVIVWPMIIEGVKNE
jgi:hypothetical protein